MAVTNMLRVNDEYVAIRRGKRRRDRTAPRESGTWRGSAAALKKKRVTLCAPAWTYPHVCTHVCAGTTRRGLGMVYVAMTYVVMAYIVMARGVGRCLGLYSYGLHSYGRHSYGLCSYDLCSYGLYSHGAGSGPVSGPQWLCTSSRTQGTGRGGAGRGRRTDGRTGMCTHARM